MPSRQPHGARSALLRRSLVLTLLLPFNPALAQGSSPGADLPETPPPDGAAPSPGLPPAGSPPTDAGAGSDAAAPLPSAPAPDQPSELPSAQPQPTEQPTEQPTIQAGPSRAPAVLRDRTAPASGAPAAAGGGETAPVTPPPKQAPSSADRPPAGGSGPDAGAGSDATTPLQAAPAANQPSPQSLPSGQASPGSRPSRKPTEQPPIQAAPSRAPAASQGTALERRRGSTDAPARPLQTLPGVGSAETQAGWLQPEEDFGRWERNARQCEIQLPAALAGEKRAQAATPDALSCRSVRLDQQLAGLLSIRFLPRAQGRETAPQQLMFAGVLQAGSQPMRCQNSRCEPQWPMRVQISAMATSSVRTLGLPQARVVQGSCSLEQERILCTARDLEGRRWQARVRW